MEDIGGRIGIRYVVVQDLLENSLDEAGAMRNLRRNTLLYVGTCVFPVFTNITEEVEWRNLINGSS
jgi:hypothetical protein